jgi:hypothetical protein
MRAPLPPRPRRRQAFDLHFGVIGGDDIRQAAMQAAAQLVF